MSNEEKPEVCEECGEEHGPDRGFELLMALEEVVYEAINKNFGPVDNISDADFQVIGTAVLGLVSSTLNEDLDLFDLKDLRIPELKDQN